jgi:hypothetical protein
MSILTYIAFSRLSGKGLLFRPLGTQNTNSQTTELENAENPASSETHLRTGAAEVYKQFLICS